MWKSWYNLAVDTLASHFASLGLNFITYKMGMLLQMPLSLPAPTFWDWSCTSLHAGTGGREYMQCRDSGEDFGPDEYLTFMDLDLRSACWVGPGWKEWNNLPLPKRLPHRLLLNSSHHFPGWGREGQKGSSWCNRQMQACVVLRRLRKSQLGWTSVGCSCKALFFVWSQLSLLSLTLPHYYLNGVHSLVIRVSNWSSVLGFTHIHSLGVLFNLWPKRISLLARNLLATHKHTPHTHT